MYKQAGKIKESKSRAIGNSVAQKSGDGKRGFGFTDNRSESIFQLKIEPEKIRGFSQVLSLPEEKIMVVDIPKNNPPNITTKFKDYPVDHTFNLTDELKGKSCKDVTGTLYPDETSARMPIADAGGAAYIKNSKISMINEGIEKYDRYLLHEIGHAAQHENMGATGGHEGNTTVMLLEWHNILFHENLFDPDDPRIAYIEDGRISRNYEEEDKKAKSENNTEKRCDIQRKMQKLIDSKYTRLDKILKKIGLNKNEKDFEIYDQVYKKFEEIKSEIDEKNLDKCFVYRCMQMNILEELFYALK
ncbi:TPA: hypothetical protein N2G48_001101 [Salmonella enterica]|nr:hypothetical protein [Salmonella enterica]